jgi:lipid-binding SYLF domain-containing protein
MQKRDFITGTAALAITGLTLTACTTTATTTDTTAGTDPDRRRREIDAAIEPTLARLYAAAQGSRELIGKASGTLIFPSVIAAGLGIGGQYGEGVLRARGVNNAYYSIASVSVGLQIGAQSKAIIFLFMTQDALEKFRNSEGWSAGADASVAVLKVGANGSIDVGPTSGPVLAFVLTNTGLMANLTLEGTKVTRLKI